MDPVQHLVVDAGGQGHAPGPLEGTGDPQHTLLCVGHIHGRPRDHVPGLGTVTNSTAGCGADPRGHLAGTSWALE